MPATYEIRLKCDNPKCAATVTAHRLEALHVEKNPPHKRHPGKLLVSTIMPDPWVAYSAFGERAELDVEGTRMTIDQNVKYYCSEECFKINDSKERLDKPDP